MMTDRRVVIEQVLFSASSHPSPDDIVATIRGYGVVLLKAAVAAAAVDRVRAALESFEQRLNDEVASGRRDAEDRDRLLRAGITGPHLEEEMLALLAGLGPVVARHVEHYLGCGDLVVPDNHFLFRKRDQATFDAALKRGTRHNFHQDHDLIPGAFPFNAWVPLSSIDDEALGLSFAFPATTQVFPVPVDIESYLERNNGFIWTPNMDVGDILLFHRYTIHGTYTTLNRPVPRYSAEFRVGTRSAAPETHLQFLRAFRAHHPTT
jgi:ectoine hydroxylase-related dioxygenase (phytanoyl-CoA dioxygenase family)